MKGEQDYENSKLKRLSIFDEQIKSESVMYESAKRKHAEVDKMIKTNQSAKSISDIQNALHCVIVRCQRDIASLEADYRKKFKETE